MSRFIAALALWCAGTATALAQVTVGDPWVRATVPGQQVAAAYMELSAPQAAKLVSAKTPVAKKVEVHEMSMSGDVMRMRALPEFVVPGGKAFTLAPGGVHFMLLGLRKPLEAGTTVPLTLVFVTGGKRQTLEVQAPVRPVGDGQGGDAHQHHQ